MLLLGGSLIGKKYRDNSYLEEQWSTNKEIKERKRKKKNRESNATIEY